MGIVKTVLLAVNLKKRSRFAFSLPLLAFYFFLQLHGMPSWLPHSASPADELSAPPCFSNVDRQLTS